MKLTNTRMQLASALLSATAALSPVAAHAETQTLKATIDGKVFESDDSGILYLIPVKGAFNLSASTKGASAYPPPTTPIDRLSILCRGFDLKPVKFVDKDFGNHGCEARFAKGESKKPFGDPDALYDARDGKGNVIEITSVKGKVIEGKFRLEMKEKKPKTGVIVVEGTFKAEDRQK